MDNFPFDLEETNDEHFFGNLKRTNTNLGQLFGAEVKRNDENPSLKYQPIKHPTASSSATANVERATPQQSWSTQIAKVANAYKAGELIGKVGVALLSNSDNMYKIIVYKTRVNVLATLTLYREDESIKLYREKRFLQFYDDSVTYWSLFFDKQDDDTDFMTRLQEAGVNVKQQQSQKTVDGKEVMSIKENVTTIDRVDANKSSGIHLKPSLVSRMAKVGQELPKLASKQTVFNATTTEYSDSSDTEAITTNKPVVVPRTSHKIQAKTQLLPVSSYSSNMSHQNGPILSSSTSSINPMDTQFIQMLFTENRTQNTELRMNINKLESKIEKVLDKMEILNVGTSNSTKSNKEDEILELEEKLLELKKENRKLKQNVEVAGTMQRQKLAEESNIPDSILQMFANQLDTLGITVTNDMKSLLSNLLDKAVGLKAIVDHNSVDSIEQSRKLHEIELKLNDEREKNVNILKNLNESQESNRTLQSTLELRDKEIQELHKRLKEKVPAQQTDTEDIVKQIMNNFYSSLNTKLEDFRDQSSREEILAIIGQTIRKETLQAIEKIKQ